MKIHVRHILVSYQYEADDLKKQLAQGKDFAELAKKHSSCPSSSRGGDLGTVDIGRLDEDFSQALETLKAGEVSRPVRTRFGWHLIQRLE